VSVLGLYLPPLLSATAPQMIISLPVHTAVCPDRADGALIVLVLVQLSEPGLYLPPLLKPPPQMIISAPVQTAVWPARAVGAFVMLIADQLSIIGSYVPPVFQ